jgi:PilZ domain
LFGYLRRQNDLTAAGFPANYCLGNLSLPKNFVRSIETIVSNLIFMDDRTAKTASQKGFYRDRRYAIRYPFAADAELLDLESGAQASGVTSDISLGGCFICTSKPLLLKARTRVRLSRKGDVVEALGVVRIVKTRVGMGVEFVDVEPSYAKILSRWIDQLRQGR